jgi:hypothetical protein
VTRVTEAEPCLISRALWTSPWSESVRPFCQVVEVVEDTQSYLRHAAHFAPLNGSFPSGLAEFVRLSRLSTCMGADVVVEGHVHFSGKTRSRFVWRLLTSMPLN